MELDGGFVFWGFFLSAPTSHAGAAQGGRGTTAKRLAGDGAPLSLFTTGGRGSKFVGVSNLGDGGGGGSGAGVAGQVGGCSDSAGGGGGGRAGAGAGAGTEGGKATAKEFAKAAAAAKRVEARAAKESAKAAKASQKHAERAARGKFALQELFVQMDTRLAGTPFGVCSLHRPCGAEYPVNGTQCVRGGARYPWRCVCVCVCVVWEAHEVFRGETWGGVRGSG